MKKLFVWVIVIILIVLILFFGIKLYRAHKVNKNTAFLYHNGNLMRERTIETVKLKNINEININSTLTTIKLNHSETGAKVLNITYWNKKDNTFSLKKENTTLTITSKKDGIIEEISGNIGKNTNVNIYSDNSNITLTGLTGGNILLQCNNIFVTIQDITNVNNINIISNNSSIEYNNCNFTNLTSNLSTTHLIFNQTSIKTINGKGDNLYAKILDCSFDTLKFSFMNGFLNITSLKTDKITLQSENSRILVSNCSFKGGILSGKNVYLNINENKIDKIKLKLTNSFIRSDTPLKNRVKLDNNMIFYFPKTNK